MCVFMNASAQRNSGRLSLGVGLLYENGMDVTLAYEHGRNVNLAVIFVRNPSGATIALTVSVWRTNLVWCVDATITATCVSELRQGATRTSFLPESMWVTSTIMCCGRDAHCSGR